MTMDSVPSLNFEGYETRVDLLEVDVELSFERLAPLEFVYSSAPKDLASRETNSLSLLLLPND